MENKSNLVTGLQGEKLIYSLLSLNLNHNNYSNLEAYSDQRGLGADLWHERLIGVEVKFWPHSWMGKENFYTEVMSRLKDFTRKFFIFIYDSRNDSSGYSSKIKKLSFKHGIKFIPIDLARDDFSVLRNLKSILLNLLSPHVQIIEYTIDSMDSLMQSNYSVGYSDIVAVSMGGFESEFYDLEGSCLRVSSSSNRLNDGGSHPIEAMKESESIKEESYMKKGVNELPLY